MEYQSYSIRQLLDSVTKGEIRIPAFQRGFVWDMERVAYLMDSIYKNYPFGSLLFWRTKNKLSIEKKIGPFQLPTAKDDYPLDYVLDGQQRLTSIFMVFQSELTPQQSDDDETEYRPLYFDLSAAENVQDCQFLALKDSDVNHEVHFPLRVLYRKATEDKDPEIIKRLDKLQERFKEVSIPVQVLKTEDRSIVAIVFERVNRLGMELDTLQLLSAWTWNAEFNLLEKFKELKEELEEFGFSEVGEDSNLILRCAAAVMQNDPTPDKLLDLNGQQLRDEFPKVQNGILGAIDFLRNQLKVSSLKNLPFSALVIPLTVFFAEPEGKEVVYNADAYNKLKKWFWRSCFSNRYTSQTTKTTINDIQEIVKLKNGKTNNFAEINCVVGDEFFKINLFRLGNANTKTFILMLANKSPMSFLSGASVDLDKVLQRYNRAEFHHVYPKAWLKDLAVKEARINSLVNFCFLSSAENKKIGRKKPSEYLSLMPTGERLEQIKINAICPPDMFNDDFENFENKRAHLLSIYANELIQPR